MITLLLALQTADTLRLPPGEVLARLEARAPALRAAGARVTAAEATRRGAFRLADPLLSAMAENIGATREITGRTGLPGIEGQVVLQFPVALGGDRGARQGIATAELTMAEVARELTTADVRTAGLHLLAGLQHAEALRADAEAESMALGRFADAMTAREQVGRESAGDAARARAEASAAQSALARRAADAARLQAELAVLLGEPDGRVLMLEDAACDARGVAIGSPRDVRLADAMVARAEAASRLAAAARVPDLLPQVGLRRTAGFSGLLVGVALELPVFGRTQSALATARAEAAAVEADRAQLVERVTATQRGRAAALARLEAAASAWTPERLADLDRAVAAAEARHAAGEGSLFELFDARRARLLVRAEYEAWRADVRRARIDLARASDAPLVATLLCTPELTR